MRGLACFLIVLFHATIEVDIRSPETLPGIVFFNDYIQFVRTPFFAFLSGFVYASRPLTDNDRLAYLRRKSRRLMLPMLFVALLTVVAKGVMDQALAPKPLFLAWLGEIIHPSFHLWFVEALFVIFVALSLGLYRFVSSSWLLIASVAVAVAVDLFGLLQYRYFSVFQAAQILPFFLAGALVQTVRIPRTVTSVSVALLMLIALGLWRTMVVTDVVVAIPYLASLAAVLALSMLGLRLAPVAWIGQYSMAIFLYHALVLAALSPRLPGSPALVLLQLAILGLGLPILLEMLIARRFPALLALTLGQTRRTGEGQVSQPSRLDMMSGAVAPPPFPGGGDSAKR